MRQQNLKHQLDGGRDMNKVSFFPWVEEQKDKTQSN